MDDVLSGTTSANTAQEYYHTSRKIFEEAVMNPRQWTTKNNKELQGQIDKDGTGAPAIVKILGLVWNSECDTLKLSLDKIIQDAGTLTKLTKRSALTIAAKLFDPLGWVESFTVRAKILMQDIGNKTSPGMKNWRVLWKMNGRHESTQLKTCNHWNSQDHIQHRITLTHNSMCFATAVPKGI